MNRPRSTLTVSIELDGVPGWGNTAEDHRALVQRLLDDCVPHYKPTVVIAVSAAPQPDDNAHTQVRPSIPTEQGETP